MEDERTEKLEAPLLCPLPSTTSGNASQFRTLGNIIVSVVGTGILGLPFAFKVSGWLAGSIGVAVAGIATCYCMLLLVQCRDTLVSKEGIPETRTYGDVGYKCMGNAGRFTTELLIVFSQCGGAIAYLIFIGQNLESVFAFYGLSFRFFVFLLVPVEIALSWIESLSSMAIVSIFADMCNLLAMAIVVKEDAERILSGDFNFMERKAVARDLRGILFAVGTAVFCFEGFGMTLALESSMVKKERFRSLLGKSFAGITLVYAVFGFSGFMAFGDQTKDIICLNLPHSWSSMAVQIGLSVALTFTFPIMLHPIREIIEAKLKKARWFPKSCSGGGDVARGGALMVYAERSVLIIALAVVASYVPSFGVFASLVGSTVCALISFVLPATFHLILCGHSAPRWRVAVDCFVCACGAAVAIFGTYNAIVGVI